MESKPLLTVVATSRNDDHGGNQLCRLQLFINGLLEQCKRHALNAELILVEWNPPQNKPKLAEVLNWPSDPGPCQVRIIEVPSGIHQRFKHSESLPLFQMIAKNVGIRRARGKFTLATNIDILFSDEMIKFIASDKLKPKHMYRVDRYDVPPDGLGNLSFEEQLTYCKNNSIRVNERFVTRNLVSGQIIKRKWRFRPLGFLRDVTTGLLSPDKIKKSLRLHTNACGDFTLLLSDNWAALRGYPEFEMYSLHIDSLLCYMAHHSGAYEKVLQSPMRIYHIEHATGSGYTPEGMDDLFKRLDSKDIPRLTTKQAFYFALQMRRKRQPIIFNSEKWGLAGEHLNETTIYKSIISEELSHSPIIVDPPKDSCKDKLSSTIGKFVIATGIGHCGTKWLSTVINQPKNNMICFHEHKTKIMQTHWYDLLQYEFKHGIEGWFDPYFGFMRDRLKRYAVVGDSGSWTMARLPEVNREIKVDRVVHLVRNGIQNVHSAFVGHVHRSPNDWIYTHYLRWYWELMDRPGDDWERYDEWGYWCLAWAYQNLLMPSWMAENLGSDKVIVCRLEDLVSDVDQLADLVQKINPESTPAIKRLSAFQKKDINRKVKENRKPEELWRTWTPEKQAVFKKICGPAMEHFNYYMP